MPALKGRTSCSGAAWQAATRPHRQAWAAANRPCALCLEPIDYTLRSPNRRALTVDHRVPLWAGGEARDPANWQPAHYSCNASRGASEGNRLRRTRRTSFTW